MKLLLSLLCCAAWMQAQPATDSQLLNEVRQLRQDLASTTLSMQRTQILLYRLQLSDAAMTRATQRADQARTQLNGLQQRLKNDADQIKAMEDELNGAPGATPKAALPSMIANLKKDMENWTPQMQDAQSKQIDAESQLRAEQAKRDALEAALDKLDKQLEAATAGRQ
jgi:chromosome segregation ATPase